ncbi:hypothetical protein [Streptomyces lancefieldiae]|uniref:Uncharacterized protein n=1 Tax=Streptomyces lancefieldiae TaxID=3075520 RepID=A0ABU3APX3_9ACTN|nr:hypothetical protein [Streptomyces sp. DSM 40712]MDT0612229.1 hypothetical protein [Streptomyces sp. DSM 40712]
MVDMVGADLAGQVHPVMLGRQGREPCTLASSPEARDEAVRRAPKTLARIRELIGEEFTDMEHIEIEL